MPKRLPTAGGYRAETPAWAWARRLRRLLLWRLRDPVEAGRSLPKRATRISGHGCRRSDCDALFFQVGKHVLGDRADILRRDVGAAQMQNCDGGCG